MRPLSIVSVGILPNVNMAYAGSKQPPPDGEVLANRRRLTIGQLIIPIAGGVMFLVGAILLIASLTPRNQSAPSIVSTAGPTTAVSTLVNTVAPSGGAVASAPAAPVGARPQQGGAAATFAVAPPELSSPGWIQNFRATHLWSGPASDGVDLGELPQWTYLQFSGESVNGRTKVLDPGDGSRRPSRAGWLNSDAVGPAGAPPVEWYMGIGQSERGLTGTPKRISEDWPAQISGQGAVIMDAQTGAVLFGKNARRRVAMASCTKMLTAIVALERGRLDDRVTVDVDGLKMAIEMESTVMGLSPGETVTLETLLYGLMLPSGNDAAVAIAKHIAGSEGAFVELMNAKARELGLEDTQIMNSHGLDAKGHFSSPFDLASIARYGMRNPMFAKLVGAKEYSGDGYQFFNSNRLLWNYPGADGVKPGFTDDAGSALVASATRDGHRVISAVIKANSAAIDSVPLLDWAFKSYSW
jgi:hypothetical protein